MAVLRQRQYRILLVLAGSFFNIFKRLSVLLPALCIIPLHASAQEILKSLPEDDTTQPWQIEADEINYDEKTLQYIASGDVTIIKGDRKLSADYVRFNRQTMKAYAKGNVKVAAGNDILTGSSMDIDLENQTGTIFDGYLFLKENNFHIKGGRIQKLGENTYAVENASLTTCEGDNPAWHITGKHLKVTIEGYGVVKHAALRTKNVPVIYTPYLVFPAKQDRQTGLLPPQFGTSDRQGFFWIQPFFWAINESSDATFYEHYMTERGHKLGLEYRYVLSDASKGTLMVDYLEDRKVDDGIGDSSEEYGFGDDDVLRPNEERYWFRTSNYQALPLNFYGKLNLDIVSDQDYLREFKYGLTGFFDTEKYFNKNFNRVFDDYADPVRTSKLNINRNWDSYSLNLEAVWFDNVINRRFEDTDPTIQKLPFVGFDASKQRIFTSPLFFNLDSEYTYLYREDGDKSHRVDIHPRVSLPYQFKQYFTLEPSVGLRGTLWYVDPDEDISGPADSDDDRFNRQIYDIKVDLTSEISKTFDVNVGTIDRIKHVILPEIAYDFIPDQDQSDLPQFDDLDLIEQRNLVTYAINNIFTWRSLRKAEGSEDSSNYDYRQFARLKFEQSYDIKEARDDDPADGTEDTERRPFSPIKGELDLTLGRYLTVDADAQWDVYEDKLNSGNIAFRVADKRNDRLYTEYRYTEDSTESVFFNVHLKISDRLATFAEYERNIFDNQRIDTVVGILYQAQCWSIEFRYIDEPEDRKYGFSIALFGLGEVGADYGD
ncbi:MAG: LPS-assembly protein LptD [Deltaproteobacteria bacterium]|nr:MAG: LPS-assembly protein LptD [Deltaproteobacteria bacterium]